MRRVNIAGRFFDLIPILTYRDWEQYVNSVSDCPEWGEENLTWWVEHQEDIPKDLRLSDRIVGPVFPDSIVAFPEWRNVHAPHLVATITFRILGADTASLLALALREGSMRLFEEANNRWDIEFIPSSLESPLYGDGIWVARHVNDD